MTPLNSDEACSATSHLLSAMISARPSSIDLVGDPQVLRFEPARGVEQQHHDLGIVDRAAGVGGRQPLELVLDLGALAQAGGVDQPHRRGRSIPIRG